MDYRDADDRVFEITQADGIPMFSGVAGTAFPHSCQAMFGFYAKTNLLKTALFDMVDAENPYAFKVLFRCLCEHHLKFMYVWTRFLREKTDDVGTEYSPFLSHMLTSFFLHFFPSEMVRRIAAPAE